MVKRKWAGWAAAAALTALAAGPALAADEGGKPTAAAAFDARRPKDVAAVVTSNGASGELKTGTDGKLTLDAQAARIFFDVYFDDCDTARTLCNTVIFSSSWDTTKVTVDEINRWNRWTLFCPAYLDAKGEPEIWDAVTVSERTSKDDVANEIDRWMGCLTDFDSFTAAPDDFLKRSAPAVASSPPAAGDGAPPAGQHPG